VEQITVSDPTRYTILFNTDGTAAIQADCNQVTAGYTTSGSSISITLGAATLAACPEGSQDQQFTTSLASAAIYFFLEGDLYIDLFADAGTMRFASGAVSGGGDTTGGDTTGGDDLLDTDSPTGGAEGTTLVLTSFGPTGAEQAVLPGTTITAVFSEGLISGSAGCNTYSAPIVPGDGFFTIGPPAVTFSICTEPEGIMEQETEFLAALVGVNGYEWVSEIENGVERIVSGRLLYTLADGTSGVMNFVAQ
jgi:heat shock protein HslJ